MLHDDKFEENEYFMSFFGIFLLFLYSKIATLAKYYFRILKSEKKKRKKNMFMKQNIVHGTHTLHMLFHTVRKIP